MKKSIFLFFMLAALLTGCMPGKEPADITEHTETKPDVSIAETAEAAETAEDTQLTGDEGYDHILRKYVTALEENWTWEQCQQNDVSPSILSDATTVRSNLGWCLLDIDKNGAEELVISDGVELFDLYVMQPNDGGPGHLLSACPNFYQLCENGLILCREYYSGRGTWRWLRLSGIDYTQQELVEYDGELNQYYYGTDGTDGHRLTPISKDEAGDLINRYQSAELTLTPFAAP